MIGLAYLGLTCTAAWGVGRPVSHACGKPRWLKPPPSGSYEGSIFWDSSSSSSLTIALASSSGKEASMRCILLGLLTLSLLTAASSVCLARGGGHGHGHSVASPV
jgi:hypothetical protein